MSGHIKIMGVILSGGQARRMNHTDKGLVPYRGRPMITYAIDAMAGAAEQIVISANRNLEQYRQFGFPVIPDQTESFDGPLAGILSAMACADSEVLLVMPCDSPLVKAEHLQKLLSTREQNNADAAVAFDGKRLHPAFLALRPSLTNSLQDYLASGQRKIDRWLEQLHTVRADFSTTPEIFININTMTDLSDLESKTDAKTSELRNGQENLDFSKSINL